VSDPTAPVPDPSPRASAPPSLDAGPVVAAVGGLAVGVSSWLAWLASVEGSPTESAFQGPAWFLIDKNATRAGLSLGILVLVVGIIVIVGAVVQGMGMLSLIGGLLGLLVVLLFTYQLNRAVNDFNDGPGVDVNLTDFLGLGVYVALVGTILAIIGGFMSLSRA
jgi:hypothetical protein